MMNAGLKAYLAKKKGVKPVKKMGKTLNKAGVVIKDKKIMDRVVAKLKKSVKK